MRARAALALILIAPAPTVGVLVGLTLRDGVLGTLLWVLAKVWLFGLPAFWHLVIDGERVRLSRPGCRWLGMGAGLGAAIGVLIVIVYASLGRHVIDGDAVRAAVEPLGLDDPRLFVALCAYIVVVNALLEEYVYRWFIFQKWEQLIGGRLAVVAAALVFTVHHVFILAATVPLSITVLGSVGVFAGGLIWSWLYLRSRSVWSGYVSHAIVDVAVLAVAYTIVFG